VSCQPTTMLIATDGQAVAKQPLPAVRSRHPGKLGCSPHLSRTVSCRAALLYGSGRRGALINYLVFRGDNKQARVWFREADVAHRE